MPFRGFGLIYKAQGLGHEVGATVSIGKNIRGGSKKFGRVGHSRAVVGKPKFAHLSKVCDLGGFGKNHMPFFGGASLFVGVAIQAFGDEKVALRSQLDEGSAGTAVGGVGDF